MVVQGPFAALAVWIWKALAYAASHRRTTWLMVADSPRSTRIHCGSLKALDQRVPRSPSTALDAGNAALSVEDAATGLPCEIRVGAAPAMLANATAPTAAPSAVVASTAIRRRRSARPARCARKSVSVVMHISKT